MALTAYSTTTWVNGSAPAINATNLQKIETGINDVTNAVISADTTEAAQKIRRYMGITWEG